MEISVQTEDGLTTVFADLSPSGRLAVHKSIEVTDGLGITLVSVGKALFSGLALTAPQAAYAIRRLDGMSWEPPYDVEIPVVMGLRQAFDWEQEYPVGGSDLHRHLIRRLRTDAPLAHLIGPGTEVWRLLVGTAAQHLGECQAEVEARLLASLPKQKAGAA